LRIQVDEQ